MKIKHCDENLANSMKLHQVQKRVDHARKRSSPLAQTQGGDKTKDMGVQFNSQFWWVLYRLCLPPHCYLPPKPLSHHHRQSSSHKRVQQTYNSPQNRRLCSICRTQHQAVVTSNQAVEILLCKGPSDSHTPQLITTPFRLTDFYQEI